MLPVTDKQDLQNYTLDTYLPYSPIVWRLLLALSFTLFYQPCPIGRVSRWTLGTVGNVCDPTTSGARAWKGFQMGAFSPLSSSGPDQLINGVDVDAHAARGSLSSSTTPSLFERDTYSPAQSGHVGGVLVIGEGGPGGGVTINSIVAASRSSSSPSTPLSSSSPAPTGAAAPPISTTAGDTVTNTPAATAVATVTPNATTSSAAGGGSSGQQQQQQPQPTTTETKRKRHAKSRTGCYNCKKRKVKCNEHWPECYNCKRLRMVCEYPWAPPPASSQAAKQRRETPPLTTTFHHHQCCSHYYDSRSRASTSSQSGSVVMHGHGEVEGFGFLGGSGYGGGGGGGGGGPSAPLRTTPLALTMEDLRFYHQFLTVAFPSFQTKYVWEQCAAMSSQVSLFPCLFFFFPPHPGLPHSPSRTSNTQLIPDFP